MNWEGWWETEGALGSEGWWERRERMGWQAVMVIGVPQAVVRKKEVGENLQTDGFQVNSSELVEETVLPVSESVVWVL